MIADLGWQELAQHRRDLRLTLFYKIVNGDIAIPTEGILVKADSRTRAKHDHKYCHISANVDSYHHSYFPRTPYEIGTL